MTEDIASMAALPAGGNLVPSCFDEFPPDLQTPAVEEWESTVQALEFLKLTAAAGGPAHIEHGRLATCFLRLWKDRVPFQVIKDAIRATISTTNCVQGFAFQKPYGYAGDFQLIDRIYQQWKSEDPDLRKWDEYFHAQPAPRAVRNRKTYFHDLLDQTRLRVGQGISIGVLNLGSGPARDVFEYLPKSSHISFDCFDLDEKAIAFAKTLCASHGDRITFHRKNVLRLRLDRAYNLLWSAGLFDYFSDRLFVAMLRRLLPHIQPGGELVVGNFSKANPSRYWMEAVGDWTLFHRSEYELLALAAEAGIEKKKMRVGTEPERVNLFLHIAG